MEPDDVPVTILLHDGEMVGPFHRKMLRRNAIIWNDKGFEGKWVALPEEDFLEIAAALAKLWEEADDDGA